MNDWAGSELLTAAEMRAIEQAAIESGEVTGLRLMERAGRGVVEAIFEEWPELKEGTHRAVVLCGPGNNGGDGFVVARRLRDKGWDVEVLFWGDPAKLPPDARTNYDVWLGMGEVHPLTEARAAQGPRPTLLVDAMFGTGVSRPIPLELARAFHTVKERDLGDVDPGRALFRRTRNVAVDCPSGFDCDSGQFLMPAPPPEDEGDENGEARWKWWTDEADKRILRADLTVTFHRRKLGQFLAEAGRKLVLCDIGLGFPDLPGGGLSLAAAPGEVRLLDPGEEAHGRLVWPGNALKKGLGHKYDHGHALILSGGPGRGGAARLAARGALRIGAGLVTLACPLAALIENAAHLDAIMLRPLADADALTHVLEDERINALCLGPGMGIELAAEMLPVALGSGRRLVLDADAVTALAADADLFAQLHDDCVLTPHVGEFARLFPDIAEKLEAPATQGPAYSKVDATRDAAARAGCTVLLKGADTVIATPDGRCAVNSAQYDRAAPWLATAGSGDVLSGFIAGLLARGLGPFAAACTGAWLHVECARSFGPGLIAEDLPEELPRVFRSLGV